MDFVEFKKRRGVSASGQDLKQFFRSWPRPLQEMGDYYLDFFEENPAGQAAILVVSEKDARPRKTGFSFSPRSVDAAAFRVGSVYIIVNYHWHYVSGCIQRNVNHVNIGLTRVAGGQIVNFHLASWWANGQQCFGIYESARVWSRCWCVPRIDWWQVTSALASGLSATLPADLRSLAWTIAGTIAAAVLATLVFLPGPP